MLLAAGMTAWVDVKQDIVRLEEKANSATDTEARLSTTLDELTKVLGGMSVYMGRVDERLEGIEDRSERGR